MKMKVKNLHFVFIILMLILVLRFQRISDIAVMIYTFVISLFQKFSETLSLINLSLIDNFVSFILLIILILYLVPKGKSRLLLNKTVSLTSIVIIMLFTFFIFAPVVSTTDSDYQNDIGISKLLPPFSEVKLLQQVNENSNGSDFVALRNRFLNENSIYIDSIKKIGDDYFYFQKEVQTVADRSKIKFKDNEPVVNSRFFILGTDEFGRDIFSRLVYGTRISMVVGLGAVLVSFLIGIGFGFLSGYSGRFLDTLLNRFTDMFLSIPVIFLIILILTFFGNSIFTIIFILGFSGWMSLFKIVRSEVISIKQKDFFITASKIGLPDYKLLMNEILPIIIAPVVVNLVFQYGNVILAEAALSYLGLGTGLNYPSWGGMIEAGQEYLSQAWWMIFFPGFALILTLFTANNLGRELNQFFNPRISK